MKTLLLPGLALGCLLLAGCFGSTSNQIIPPPGATASDAMRVGDKVTVQLSGVPSDSAYIKEVQVPESGEVSVPDLSQRFQVVGMLPGALGDKIAAAYRDEKIYTNPNVTVIPEERYVSVGGDVRNPSRVIYTPDLTLLGAVNSCGGFDDYAEKHRVRVIRGSQIYYINAVRALNTPGQDPKVYPGDQIFVPRTPL